MVKTIKETPARIVAACIALLLMVSPSAIIYAQGVTISGTVIEAAEGYPLPGVNILVKGTTTGTTTDASGDYELAVPSLQDTLVFSFVGYERQEVPIGGRRVVNVRMRTETITGEELVVVGYGQRQRSDLTGSVSSINEGNFNEGVVLSPNQLIQGRAAGVDVVQTSGQPGGGSAIAIRGSGSLTAGTEPLFVIDGVPIENSQPVTAPGEGVVSSRAPRDPLSSINPADIESVEILKDASATAIFGARGANGVVLITTKSGQPGRLRVNYSGSMSVQNRSNKLELLSPEEYRDFVNDIIDKGAADGRQELKVTEIQGGGTDWQDALTRGNAFMQEHNLAFSGGDDDTRYRVSLNVLNQEGVAISSAFQRYGARLNLDETGDRYEIGLKLNTTYSKDDVIPHGFASNIGSGVFYAATYFDPTLSIYDAEGNFQTSPLLSLVNNPVSLAHGEDPISDTYRTFGTVHLRYDLVRNLKATVRLGGDVNSEQKRVYVDRRTMEGSSAGGIATRLEGRNTNYLFEGLMQYDRSAGGHVFDILGGATFQKFINYDFASIGRGFPSDATKAHNMNLADPQSFSTSSNTATNSLLSFLARTNYSINDLYLITMSVRADGSSRFGENQRFGYFPSAALAWKAHNTPLIREGANYLSTLKPRVSWGITGNQAIGNYNSLITFTSGGPTFMGQQPVSTIDPSRIPNPDLRWEKTTQFNVGLDFGFFKERVSGTLDWYSKATTDMLLNMPVPTSTGFGSRLTNIGAMTNTGVELSLSTRNITTRDFSWRSTLNLARVVNEVTDLGGLDQIITGNLGFTGNMFIIQEGLPANAYYGYEVIGVWQEGDDFSVISNPDVIPGNLKYRDVNNDGVITSDDRVILGDSYPDLQLSIANRLRYRNWQLNVFIAGAFGHEMLNNNLVDTYFPVNVRRNRYAEPIRNRWTPENPSNKYPSFVHPFTQGEKAVNSLTVEDASYLKLHSVSIVYNIPARLSGAFESAAVSLTGHNLITLTNYSGLDPALNPNGTAYSRIDFNAYPPARTFTLGVNLRF